MGHLPALFAGGRPFFDGQNNSNYLEMKCGKPCVQVTLLCSLIVNVRYLLSFEDFALSDDKYQSYQRS